MKFIEVIRDGAARISSETPDDVNGVYTTSLATCIVLIIRSTTDAKLSFMHLSNWRHDQLDVNSAVIADIAHEIRWVGNQFKLYVGYNPKVYVDDSQQFTLDINNLMKILGQKLDVNLLDGRLTIQPSKGWTVAIDRQGNFCLFEGQEAIRLPDSDKRNYINLLNTVFLDRQKTTFYRDYNESYWLPPNKLCAEASTFIEEIIKTGQINNIQGVLLEQMRDPHVKKAFIEALRTTGRNNPDIAQYIVKDEIPRCIKNYLAKTERGTQLGYSPQFWAESILRRYKIKKEVDLPTPKKALRRAARVGTKEDIGALIRLVADINSQDDNPDNLKTALHWAVIGGKVENARILISKGAYSNIMDAQGKTAAHYAKDSGNEELTRLFATGQPAVLLHD